MDDRNDFGEFVFEAPNANAPTSSKPVSATKSALTELREKLYATSFEQPTEWKKLKSTLQLGPDG